MRSSILSVGLAALVLGAAAQAETFTFISEDPFAGSGAAMPGRQVVGGETFIDFNPATDVFALGGSPFAFLNNISFANGTIENIPAAGTNVAVLRTFDNDNNPVTPFGAGNAANLLAERITTPGPGLFVYFNSGLDLPRLVYSTDLSDNTADLKILFRMTNPEFAGAAGRDAMQQFTESNFAVAAPIPEPSTILLLGSGAAFLAFVRAGKRRGRRDKA